ncbi:MAG: hypothetical protein QNK05_12835 [Myxococcota bacterium]|nr:hypothetical protein [Myxococcota bacterium]
MAADAVLFVAGAAHRDDWAESFVARSQQRFPEMRVEYAIDLAAYYERRRNVRRAESILRGLAASADDGFPRAMLGLLLERQGRREEAADELERALAAGTGASPGYERALREKIGPLRREL